MLAWQPVAPLPLARWGAASVTLQDGRVLVLGGTTTTTSAGAVARVEIFDPANGAWQTAAPLGVPRAYPVAILLTDGRVLVTGGSDHQVPLASAEIYDPATNSWSITGSMSVGRTDFAGVRLPDGRVLVAGGGTTTSSGPATNTAEIYDPSSGAWQRVASMHTRRAYLTLTALGDGRVLAAGGLSGYPSQGAASATAEIYDPASNSWTVTAPLVGAVYSQTANLLPDGSVLLAGGWNSPAQSAGALPMVQLFDPRSGIWTSGPPMLEGRAYARTVTLLDGRVVVAGGFSASGTPLASVELYDPRNRAWSALSALAAPEWGGALALLSNGEVLVAGGSAAADGSSPTRNAELLDLVARSP